MAEIANKLAYVFGGENFTHWNSATDKIESLEINKDRVDEALDEITKKAKDAAGKKITVVVSWAGSKGKDAKGNTTGTFSMNNFPIRDQKRAEGSFNFKEELDKKLKEAGVDPSLVNLRIENDGDLSLEDSALTSKIPEKSRALGVLLGSGLSVSDGINYQGNAKFKKILSADSSDMPDLEKYKAVEGNTRQYSESDKAGTAAAYITGGHEGEEKLGAKATAVHLVKLGESGTRSEMKEAMKLLYRDEGFFKKIWNFVSFAGMRRKKLLKTSELTKLIQDHQKITNARLLEAAEKGDKLSLQILIFTSQRIVDFIKQYIDSAEDKTEIKNLFLYGAFANNLLKNDSAKLKPVRKAFEKALRKVTKAKITVNQPEMDGAKDLAKKLE